MNLTVNREGKYAIVWMTNAEKVDTTPHRFFLPQIDGIGVENT